MFNRELVKRIRTSLLVFTSCLCTYFTTGFSKRSNDSIFEYPHRVLKSYYHCVNDDTPCTVLVLYPSFLFTILHSSQNPTVHLDRHIQPNPSDPVRRDIYNCRRSLVIMVHPLKILLTYILGYY